MSGSGTLAAIGTAKGLFLARSEDDRRTWSLSGPFFGMSEVYAVALDTRGGRTRVLAGSVSWHWGPTVARSDDLGATWEDTERGAVRFPEGTDAAVARVWQLAPAPADQPGVVYGGVEPTALFRSTDGGETFSLVEGLWNHPHRKEWQPGGGGQCLHTVLPHPTDPERILVAMSTGGVYRSADAGASWAPANRGIAAEFLPDEEPEFGQCVHKVARHPDRPDQLFAQNHGGVYRSDNGGDRWVSIADGLPADFGFPMVADPNRPGSAYVFPLVDATERLAPDRKCRVFRTDDAGETWQGLETGLPSDPHFGVVLRDGMCADDADPAGVYFGNRNGEVYASADRGESWQQIAAHLPAVLCVRAATLP